MRRLLLLATLFCLGCVSETDSRTLVAKAGPQTPVSDATRQLAARVDQLGSELVTQNPFLGVSPTFMVVGRPGREVGHPDLNGVLVSEGLAAQLSDDELAGVLALELGRMAVEARRARAVLSPRPMPVLPSGGDFDPTHAMTQTLVENQARVAAGRPVTGGGETPREVAARILTASGRKATLLDAAETVHAEASRHSDGPSELGGKPAPPHWTN